MKKVIGLLLAVMMVLSLSACGGNETATDNDTGSSTTQNQTDVTDTSSTEQNTDAPSSTTDNSDSSNNTDVPGSTTSTPTTTTKPETSTSSTTTKPETSTLSTTTKPNTTKPETPKPTTTTKPNTTTHTHSYSSATCTTPQKCSCGATSGTALGHKWQEATCQAPKTCSACKAMEGETVQHSFDSSGKCVWCKQILSVSPDEVKNREYEYWNGWKVFSFNFATSIASAGIYMPCADMYSETWCGNEEGHIIVNGVGSHCAAGSGPLSFTHKKTEKNIVISNLETFEDMVLTLEVLSNDTLRVVNVTGTAPNGLGVGDIFK